MEQIYSMIPIDNIRVSSLNIRADVGFGDEKDQELVESIKAQGVIQPISVRPVGDIYEVYLGRRRFLAAEKVGLTEIPCIVKNVDDETAMYLSLTENTQRKGVDFVTLGWSVRRMQEISGKSLRELSRELGIPVTTLGAWCATTTLTDEMQHEVQRDVVSLRNALEVVKLDLTPAEEKTLAEESRSGGYNSFKTALDRVSKGREKRGAPSGLLITRINWGFESVDYEALNRFAEAEGINHSDYCQKVLVDHIQAQGTQA